jgi:O-6-methylguanine DNA methyltransferase
LPQSLEIKRFNKGPAILVRIFKEEGILRSSLELSDTFACVGADTPLLKWLEAYAEGQTLSFPTPAGNSFQQRVWENLCKIPFGSVLSYQELAFICDCPRGARAIGNACGSNPLALFIPCHRVIRKNGGLGGFGFNIEIKKRLLEFEESKK